MNDQKIRTAFEKINEDPANPKAPRFLEDIVSGVLAASRFSVVGNRDRAGDIDI